MEMGMELTRIDSGCGRLQADPLHGLIEKAEAALSANRAPEAVTYFDEVLKNDPFCAKAHCGLSSAFWGMGRTEDALNSLTRALELEPDDQAIVLQCSRFFQAFGKSDDARDVLESYISRHPNAESVRAEAESLKSRGRNGNGEVSDVSEFFRKQGLIQFEQGRQDRAISCLEMAIENNPASAEAHRDLGAIYMQDGDLKNALQYFYNALDLNPEDPEILSYSARALSQAGEKESAVQAYREYLRRRPTDENAWTEYENLLRRIEAPVWDASTLSAEVGDIYTEMARKLFEAGDLSGAAEAVDKALKLRPETVEPMLILAALHCEIGQPRDAAEVLEQALELNPSSKECLSLLEEIRKGYEIPESGEVSES